MKKKLIVALSLLASFVIWTLLVRFADVKPIGANETVVGFATLNGFVHGLTGTNMLLYTITDWLGLVPIITAFGFAVFGLIQLIKRKSLLKVDSNILALGGFYAVVASFYLFFEAFVINYRPILINGILEASYPSSTTMLVLCVMPTALIQLNSRVKALALKRCIATVIILFTAFMVIARLLSGVHWITDIIGGALLSLWLVVAYSAVVDLLKKKIKTES